MKRKIVSIIVVVLFFGLAIAPSINANINKEDDLVELDVEFCGLGKKHTVKLTQEEYNEVELIFDDMQERLSNVKSDDEAVEIFNEAIVKLDKYGLLGGLSVKLAQRLITSQYQLLKDNQFLQNKLDIGNLETHSNSLCLIGGRIAPSAYQNPIGRLICYFMIKFYELEVVSDIILYLAITIPQMLVMFFTSIFPISAFSTMTAGSRFFNGDVYHPGYVYTPSEGNIFSYGLSGYVKWNGELWGDASENSVYVYLGELYPAVLGFIGLKIVIPKYMDYIYFLGFAMKASMRSG